MRKKEILFVSLGTVIAVGGIGYAMSHRGAMGGVGGITEDDYIKVVGTPAPNETIFDENGNLTREAEEKYVSQADKLTSEVTSKVDVEQVKAVKKMPRVEVVSADMIQKKITKKTMKTIFESALKQYGLKRAYDVQYETGDEAAGEEPTSQENPYYYIIQDAIMTAENGESTYKHFMLNKEYDDGMRLPKQSYSRENALQEMQMIAENFVAQLDVDYTISDSETWEFEEGYTTFRDEMGKKYLDADNASEADVHHYQANIFFAAAGFPVIGTANVQDADHPDNDGRESYLSITYAENGLQSLDGAIMHNYKVSKQMDTGILSYSEAFNRMKQAYTSARVGAAGGYHLEVQRAYLGYIWIGDSYLQPVWAFFGEQSRIIGNECKMVNILLDAKTGEPCSYLDTL